MSERDPFNLKMESMEEGLRYIADCLEKQEIYSPSTDQFVRGPAINPLLINFARKLADGKLPGWEEWVAKKNGIQPHP